MGLPSTASVNLVPVRERAGRVPVVDDVDGNVRLAAAVLEPHGSVASSVSDGESALDEIHHSQPDLILLDVMMPGLDGFETCRQLKENPETRLRSHTSEVRPIVRSHHERLDGSGYPDALAGDDIPLLAQIIGVVDVYDAMTTDRPYRRATTPREGCEDLLRETRRGRHRRDLVEAFVSLVKDRELPMIGGLRQL